MKKCDRDCFNCEYDDCVQNSMTAEEREEINARNNNLRESINPAKQRDLEKSKQYYRDHLEECRRKSREYYRANKEKYKEYKRKMRQALRLSKAE